MMNYEIAALVRSENISWDSKHICLIRGDLTEIQNISFNNKTFDIVVHFAALMADNDYLPASEFKKHNVEGTYNLISKIKECHVKQFLLISTVGIYGATTTIPVEEDADYGSHLSPYEASKMEAETISKEMCRKFGIPLTILRLGLMYGEQMTYGWPNVVDLIRKNQLCVIGSGEPLIQLSYLRDIIDGVALAVGNSEAYGSTFNICGGYVCSISEVFNTIADLLNRPHPRKIPYTPLYLLSHGLVFLPEFFKSNKLKLVTPHRVRFFKENHVYSIKKAKRVLRFSPKYDIKSGMRIMINLSTN